VHLIASFAKGGEKQTSKPPAGDLSSGVPFPTLDPPVPGAAQRRLAVRCRTGTVTASVVYNGPGSAAHRDETRRFVLCRGAAGVPSSATLFGRDGRRDRVRPKET
jgi:hypothetical protein